MGRDGKAGRGNAGRSGRLSSGRSGSGGQGRGSAYSNKPRTTKVGLCKELDSNVFDYGVHNAADLMRTTQEKIVLYVGAKYGEDIANELNNKATMTIPPPAYSAAIVARHQQWEVLVRKKQNNMLAALRNKLIKLEAERDQNTDIDYSIEIAELENEIDEAVYEQSQDVPYKLTQAKVLEYSNEFKLHSHRVANLEKHRGIVYLLIIGQCTQILQDKMKQDQRWNAVSASYKPLDLYKLIKRVILRQTEDQYPVAAVWKQLVSVYSSKQGNMTNNEWYEQFTTKIEVAESVGCEFEFPKIWEYCAQNAYAKSYSLLTPDEQDKARATAKERFLAYALMKTSSNTHKKIKTDLSDDFTKGTDNYPETRQQTLLLLNKYTKKPTMITQSEGTSFAQKGSAKKADKKSDGDKDEKKTAEYNKEYFKDKMCFRCRKLGHPKAACKAKPVEDDNVSTKSSKSTKSTKSGKSASPRKDKVMSALSKGFKTMGKAMSQIHQEGDYDFSDNESEQSHAQICNVSAYLFMNETDLRQGSNAFASNRLKMSDTLLLDNQSSVHVFCNPEYVSNIRKAAWKMQLRSNGGNMLINEIATYKGFDEAVWFLTTAMTNILSFARVKREYRITYEGDDFITHRRSNGFSDMVFKPHPSGLRIHDPCDKRGLASFCFLETVDENKAMFTNKQIASADKARNLHAGLAFLSMSDYKWALQANLLQDCPVTVQDLSVALKIWGPSVAMMQGKTVRKTPPPVQQSIILIPKEIRQRHKKVTLVIDIFFVNKIPFFVTLSLRICFLSATHMANRKAITIFKALRSMFLFYLQRGFTVVFIKADGEFAPLQEWMHTLFGAPKLNLTSANEHVAEIEQKIRVIKERVREVIYSLPFNAIPQIMLTHAVLFVTKQLNLFPVKGGILAQFSPRQILSGETAEYRFCSMGFGQYCQIHKEDAPRNSMAARTKAGLSLGPSGNAQGGHKFLSLLTGKVVTRRAWTALPTPQAIIDQVHMMARGQPSLPIFTDRQGNPIGDVTPNFGDEWDPGDTKEEPQGVMLPESEVPGELPGVDTGVQEPFDKPQAQMFDLEGTSPPEPQEPPLINLITESDVVQKLEPSADQHQHQRKSTRTRVAPNPYKPSWKGKSYAYALTQLGRLFLDDEEYQHDPRLAFCFMQQMLLKAALKNWGNDAEKAGVAEASQLHWRNTFIPRRYADLTPDQREKILESHMFVVKKRTGKYKARLVAGGNKQRDYLSKEEASSPTVSTESVLLTAIIDAKENHNVAIVDIPNAFIQTVVDDEQERVILRIRGAIVEMMLQIAPEVYTEFVTIDKRGNKQLLVECTNAINGTMVAGLLYYRKFATSLKEKGFEMNPYDPCVWNKIIDGKQCTICFHVDDCKISHVLDAIVSGVIEWLRWDYKKLFTDGSGKMKVTRGKIHKYLGMTLDFRSKGIVKVTMIKYVDKIIKAFDAACRDLNYGYAAVVRRKKYRSAAPEDLFKIDQAAVKLNQAEAVAYHNITAKSLYVTKRARPDVLLAVAFLTTRVRGPDVDDWKKLRHMVEYLRGTRDLPLVLGANSKGVLSWYVDASFAVHPNMKGHTGRALTLGIGCPVLACTKQKLNTRSSTESEFVGVDDLMPMILWVRLFMKAQGFKVVDIIVYQDNQSAILLERNGRASSSKRMRHIEIRYYFATDRISKKDLRVEWCPTLKMLADFMTKPLQGKVFTKLRDIIMGSESMVIT